MRGMVRMDPLGETMFGLLHNHDAIAAANAPVRPPDDTAEVMVRRSPSGRSSYGVARSRRKPLTAVGR